MVPWSPFSFPLLPRTLDTLRAHPYYKNSTLLKLKGKILSRFDGDRVPHPDNIILGLVILPPKPTQDFCMSLKMCLLI